MVVANSNKPMPADSYIAIDLKSFYASVECVERGLDPLDALLVVADQSRTDKTICLAVSPALKAFGTGGRPRLFEVIQKIRDVNRRRGRSGVSTSGIELGRRTELAVDYIVAPPRMALYKEYSRRIYNIYLRYVAPEDIHVYSIDEVIIYATPYLSTYGLTPHELAMVMIRDVLANTGVTATAGIGSNMYLAKVAMDIVAKKMLPDKDGVRIAELDEMSYRHSLWNHVPLTDFWRVGARTARRLAMHGMYTMGDVAMQSHRNDEVLYKMFGVNAELLIDHAWGWEPVTMPLVKAYRPETHSICSGQVLSEPYTFDKARNVVREMADAVSLDLTEIQMCTFQIVLHVSYDVKNMELREGEACYNGAIHIDHYGRRVPRGARGSVNTPGPTSLGSVIIDHVTRLYDRIVDPHLLIRRLSISLNKLIPEREAERYIKDEEVNLFTDIKSLEARRQARREAMAREHARQEVTLRIKRKFGKNALLRGINFTEGATQRERNTQIGGHHE